MPPRSVFVIAAQSEMPTLDRIQSRTSGVRPQMLTVSGESSSTTVISSATVATEV